MNRAVYFGIILSIILITGCSSATIGNEQLSEIHIEKDEAKQLAIDLTIDYGRVDISTEDEVWVDGEIKYNVDDLEPRVNYKLKRQKGKIKIDQPKKHKIDLKKGLVKNDWNLLLSRDVPVDLTIETGAADTTLDLQGMQLRSLDIDTGVGKMNINLGGIWLDSYDVDIQMGVGESTVILPKEVGVKIKSTKGIGFATYDGFISKGDNVYVNEAFEDADVIVSVHAELGVGEVNFKLED